MKSSKKKSLNHKSRHTQKLPIESNLKKSIQVFDFEEYIGHTITVYVDAGGMAGKGFTGVLTAQTETYIRLLVLPSVPPSCSLGNACGYKTDNILFCLFCPHNKNVTMGAVVEISITSIVAFVHN